MPKADLVLEGGGGAVPEQLGLGGLQAGMFAPSDTEATGGSEID